MMIGSIAAQEAVLIGIIKSSGTLSGMIQTKGSLVGKIAVTVDHEYYVGDYNVIPKIELQVLKTQDKLMSSDVTIKGIPSYEVSNPQGGSTFIIGGNYIWIQQ